MRPRRSCDIITARGNGFLLTASLIRDTLATFGLDGRNMLTAMSKHRLRNLHTRRPLVRSHRIPLVLNSRIAASDNANLIRATPNRNLSSCVINLGCSLPIRGPIDNANICLSDTTMFTNRRVCGTGPGVVTTLRRGNRLIDRAGVRRDCPRY